MTSYDWHFWFINLSVRFFVLEQPKFATGITLDRDGGITWLTVWRRDVTLEVWRDGAHE